MSVKVVLPADTKNELLHIGVQGIVFVQRPIDLESSVGIIEGETLTGRPKVIKKKDQLDAFADIMKSPLKAPYVLCISSATTDMRAKYVAAFILEAALRAHNKVKHNTNQILPRWHVLTGSYQDELRDRASQNRRGKKPALIVLTNITSDSSDVKLEKLRDLLELYSDVPRIVTYTGTDPVTFFNQRLKYPLNAAINITSRVKYEVGRKSGPPKKSAKPEGKSESSGVKKVTRATTEI